MKYKYKKLIVISIIFLFIGISYSSAIGVDTKTSYESLTTDNDFIELPVSIHTSKGIQRHTLELTNQQVDELGNIFDKLKVDLWDCDSHYEVTEVYKEAIVSLDENGLLPDGLSVEEAGDLILRNNINPKLQKVLSYLFSILTIKQVFNLLCYVSGESDDTDIFWGIIFYGGRRHYGHPYEANGWIYTNGLCGKQYLEGLFYGEISWIPYAAPPGNALKRIGGIGFRGFSLKTEAITYYFGIAKWIWVKELESDV